MLKSFKLSAGQSFYELPMISALLMALGRSATLGDVARLLRSK